MVATVRRPSGTRGGCWRWRRTTTVVIAAASTTTLAITMGTQRWVHGRRRRVVAGSDGDDIDGQGDEEGERADLPQARRVGGWAQVGVDGEADVGEDRGGPVVGGEARQ